ncbi:GGDEF domain-containing protein [Methylopila turkensis]|uniref:GGDEF domain-containing protein n=1 Tax=Methylopila turkensis TaxID=1437816 RepID=A0A9W6JNG9_9HYPH|nr:GGDEF domain-containing protein [Methylopila turkensis]GLK80865.1 hypothetical protein GCM10008174_26060 [Methylopila turkensis]
MSAGNVVYEYAAGRLRAFRRNRNLTLTLCYAIALIAGRVMGEGASGQPMLALAAPVAVGVLIRMGGSIESADFARFAAAHLMFGFLFGDPLETVFWDGARSIAHVAFALLLFRAARTRGLIRSPIYLMGTLVAVAVASAAPGFVLDVVRLSLEGALSPSPLIVGPLVDILSMALMLAIVLTQGRGCLPTTPESGHTEEKRPGSIEHLSAVALAAALIWFSLDGGALEAVLAGSIALLWFALRLGLFATTVAAFAFAVVELKFGTGRGLLIDAADPAVVEALRYVKVALLTAPSIVVATVVYEQQRLRRLFAYRANHDGLTGLINRVGFTEHLELQARRAGSGHARFLLMLIDLDHFKSINDTFGHASGDELLVKVAERLRSSLRATDVVARLGGDEFAALAPVPSVDDAMRLAKRLVETVNQTCEIGGVALRPSVTVGGVLAPDNATDPQRLMLLADEALYKAKAAGRNGWRFASMELKGDRPSAAMWRPEDAEVAMETVFLD